jgi:predicted enzyme related to lactoylglutathione lyase
VIDPTRLCQIELQVTDLKAAAQFYAEAFGWQVVPAELHEYVVLQVPDGCPFGIALTPKRADGGASPGNVVLYFGVDDPEAVTRAVEKAGGKKRFGPMPLMGYGSIYQVEDPEGTRFGLYLKKTTAR